MDEPRLTMCDGSFEDIIEEGYPFFPFVIPLVPLLLMAAAVYFLWRYLDRITASVERQEKLLKQIATDTRRLS